MDFFFPPLSVCLFFLFLSWRANHQHSQRVSDFKKRKKKYLIVIDASYGCAKLPSGKQFYCKNYWGFTVYIYYIWFILAKTAPKAKNHNWLLRNFVSSSKRTTAMKTSSVMNHGVISGTFIYPSFVLRSQWSLFPKAIFVPPSISISQSCAKKIKSRTRPRLYRKSVTF